MRTNRIFPLKNCKRKCVLRTQASLKVWMGHSLYTLYMTWILINLIFKCFVLHAFFESKSNMFKTWQTFLPIIIVLQLALRIFRVDVFIFFTYSYLIMVTRVIHNRHESRRELVLAWKNYNSRKKSCSVITSTELMKMYIYLHFIAFHK